MNDTVHIVWVIMIWFCDFLVNIGRFDSTEMSVCIPSCSSIIKPTLVISYFKEEE